MDVQEVAVNFAAFGLECGWYLAQFLENVRLRYLSGRNHVYNNKSPVDKPGGFVEANHAVRDKFFSESFEVRSRSRSRLGYVTSCH